MNFFQKIKKNRESVKNGGSGFPCIISEYPSDDFLPHYTSVNDEQLIFNNKLSIIIRIIYSIPLIIWIGIVIYATTMFTPMDFGEYFITFMSIILFILCLFGLVFLIINPQRKVVFNRLQGTVTLPAYKWKWLNKTTVTHPFAQTRFCVGGSRSSDNIYVGIPGTLHTIFFLGSKHGEQIKDFSALVWYMDKNRPLPPGKDLDPYREKDYERRKAEGFPKPLYPSQIKILEWEGVKSI